MVLAQRRCGCETRGVAAAEFVLIALPLLLAGLAVLEVANWHAARLVVGQATLAAARAGQDGWRAPELVQQRFETALLPLWGADASAAGRAAALARLRAEAKRLHARSAIPLWQMTPSSQRLTPEEPEFLVLDVRYMQAPLIPGMSALLRHLGTLPPHTPTREAMRRSGWLPIRQRIAIEWQTVAAMPAGALGVQASAPAPTLAPPSSHTPPAAHSMWLPPECVGGECFELPPAPVDPPDSPWPIAEPELCGVLLCCE